MQGDDVTLDDAVEQPDEEEEGGVQNSQEEKAVKRKRTVEDEGGAIDVSAAEAAAGALAEAAAGSVLEANGEELVVARLRGLPWSFNAVEVCDFVAAVGVTAQPEAVTMLHNAAGEAFITLESKSQETEVLKANRQQVGKRYVEVFSSSATEKQAACDRNRATMRDDAGYRGVLRMRGLPFSAVVDEVLDFFGQSAALKRENIHLMRRADGRASGDAYAVFDTEEAAVAALSLDKQKLGTRWVDLFQSSKGELYSLTSVGGIMLGSETLGLTQGGEAAEPAVALGDGYFVIKLRGLPWNVSIDDIAAFLAPIPVPQGGVHLMNGANGRPSGLAYVELGTEDGQKEAMLKDKQSIGGRYIDIFSCSQNELQARLAGGLERGWQAMGRQNAGAADACFVKLRGLPYSADQHQIGGFFQPLLILGMQVALNNSAQPSGFGFVQFRSAEDVTIALSRSGQVMGSRYVEVFRSTRMEMEQARMHAMAMRPPHMQHHHGHGGQHHGGQHGGHGGHGGHNGHAQHGGHGGQPHGGYGAHHAAAHGGHAQHKGGQHGGESAYAAYQSAMQTLACRPPPGYGHPDPTAYGTASGYAPPAYGAAEGVPYSAAPPAAGYGSQGYAAPPGGAGGAGGSYGYGGQPSGYEQWGYYAQ